MTKDDDFSSVKLPTAFVEWLRIRAKKQGQHQYRVVLDAVAKAVGGRPWDKQT